MKVNKSNFLRFCGISIILLALIRCAFPSIAEKNSSQEMALNDGTDTLSLQDSANIKSQNAAKFPILSTSLKEKYGFIGEKPQTYSSLKPVKFTNNKGEFVPHRIYSVPSFAKAFPDSNHVQLAAAKFLGVPPVANRKEAESKKSGLVYAASSPYYVTTKMTRSIPYLVPQAYVLLNDIGRNFFDSLSVKGIPLHKIMVTSVLRTKEDVINLRKHNKNATENSTHQYGTTFDITYLRFKSVDDINGKPSRTVRNDTLKWVLSEVLNDLRNQKRCYVKYEKKQSCFHITVR